MKLKCWIQCPYCRNKFCYPTLSCNSLIYCNITNSVLIIIIFTVATSADSTMLSMDPGVDYSPTYLQALTAGGNFSDGTGQLDSSQRNRYACYTPPDSVNSAATPSPSGTQTDATGNGQTGNNFDCTSILISNPGPSSSALVVPARPSPPRRNADYLSTSVPVNGRIEERLVGSRLAARHPQLISAQCSQASIEILNPREEYDKVQKKHGPKGKYSEQRISSGQVWTECLQVNIYPLRLVWPGFYTIEAVSLNIVFNDQATIGDHMEISLSVFSYVHQWRNQDAKVSFLY